MIFLFQFHYWKFIVHPKIHDYNSSLVLSDLNSWSWVLPVDSNDVSVQSYGWDALLAGEGEEEGEGYGGWNTKEEGK